MNPLLAKHKAAVTPMKPKNGAEVGQVSYDTVVILSCGRETGFCDWRRDNFEQQGLHVAEFGYR